MTSPTVSVVICAYTSQRLEQIVAAVRSVQAQTHAADEIVLAIDHNPELTGILRATLDRTTGVVITDSVEPKGLSGARNHGIATSTGDIVAFLDDDAVAEPRWLERLVAHYATSENVLGVGGYIAPLWGGNKPRLLPEEFYWVVGCSYRGMPTTVADVRNLIGANMSFRRSALADAGGFRSDLGRVGTRPAGCEETELSIRMRRANPRTRLLHVPDAVVHHHVPSSRSSVRYFAARCLAEGGSKAIVVRESGSDLGLQSERQHALKALPRAVGRGVGDAVHGDISGLGRAAMVLLGLGLTGFGYIRGRLSARRGGTTNPVPLDRPTPTRVEAQGITV